MVKLFVLGKDKRSECLRKMYEKENVLVDSIEESNIVILPIPFTKDKVHITGEEMTIDKCIEKCMHKSIFSGAIPRELKRKLEINNIMYVDLMESDAIAYLNAIPTAEGAIARAMELTEYTLHGANVMVIGFGRVGKILAHKLKGLDANIYCVARKEKDLALINALGYNVIELNTMEDHLKSMDIIFSTVPTMVLNERRLKLLKKNALIIDLASSPGSVDYEAAKKINVNAVLELGIPSKVAPKSAASYIKSSIDRAILNQ